MSHTTYCQCGNTSWSWNFIKMIRQCLKCGRLAFITERSGVAA